MKYLNIKKALAAWQELQPLSEKDKDRLSRRFTVDFNYNSNHIEGNTLTYGQAEILLLFGKVICECVKIQNAYHFVIQTTIGRKTGC